MKFFLMIFWAGMLSGSLMAQDSLPDAKSLLQAVRQQFVDYQNSVQVYSMNIYSQTFFYFRSNPEMNLTMKGASFRHLSVYRRANGTIKKIETACRHLKDLPTEEYIPYTFERIENLTDDNIPVAQASVVGPLSPSAPNYYNYSLQPKTIFHGKTAYEIRIIPKSQAVPLFDGSLYVLDTLYRLAGFQFSFNPAVKIFPKPQFLTLRQAYKISENEILQPDFFEWEYELRVNLPGFHGNGYWKHAEQVVEYQINPSLPASIFGGEPYAILSDAPYHAPDFWDPSRYLPLSERESQGLRFLMALKKNRALAFPNLKELEDKRLERDYRADFSIMPDPRFNRVEGPFTGVTVRLKDLSAGPYLRSFFARGDYGYGFSDKRHKWQTEVGKSFFRQRLALGAGYYNGIQHKENILGGSLLMTSLTALGYRYDIFHYFYIRGYELFFRLKPFYPLETETRYISRNDRSARQRTNFGIVRFLYEYKPNYTINEGRLNQIAFRWKYHYGEGKGIRPRKAYLRLNGFIEHSSPKYLKSDFTFTRYYATARWHLPTTRRGSLDGRIYGGFATKSVPRQYLFDLYGGSLPYMMKTVALGELEGNYMAAMTIEHNFGGAWLEKTGLPVLKEGYIDMIPNISIGYVKTSGRTRNFISYPVRDTKSPLIEAGLGFGDIYRIARVDFAYRLNGRKAAESFWVLTASAFLFNE